MQHTHTSTASLILLPGEGRSYPCGSMTAIFKADENETDQRYSISEWWLEPNSAGPGSHLHEDNDEVFYIIEGTMTVLIAEQTVAAPKGTFIRIPAKTMHDFSNQSNERAGLLNFFIPGGFERNMPAIVKWFEENQ